MTSSVQCSSTELEQSGAWTGSRRDARAGTVTSNEIIAGVALAACTPGSVISNDSSAGWSALRFVTLMRATPQSWSSTHACGRAGDAGASFRTSCETNTSELYL